jgi:hypothetical protein
MKSHNPAYNELLFLREMVTQVIEDVVTFENGGLNTSLDAMVEVTASLHSQNVLHIF